MSPTTIAKTLLTAGILSMLLAFTSTAEAQTCQTQCSTSRQNCINSCNGHSVCLQQCESAYQNCLAGCCKPNFQVVNTVYKGIAGTNNSYTGRCSEDRVYKLIWHDMNNCPGSKDYATCTTSNVHSHTINTCCRDVVCNTTLQSCLQ